MLSKFFGSGRGVDRPDQPDQPDRPDHEPGFGRHGNGNDSPADGGPKVDPAPGKGAENPGQHAGDQGSGGQPVGGQAIGGQEKGQSASGITDGPATGPAFAGPAAGSSADVAYPTDFGGGTGGSGAPPSNDLGWDEAAFDEAGGFEAVLGDVLLDWLSGTGDDRPAITVNIDTIDIDLFNIVQNTLVQNTQVLFDASGGGSVSVGGDVMALGVQEALVADAGGFLPF